MMMNYFKAHSEEFWKKLKCDLGRGHMNDDILFTVVLL